MRQLCGSGRVIALEPDPVNRARLERTLVLNDARDVQVIAKAAGARDEVVVLRRYEHRPTSSTVEGTDKGSPYSEIRVPAITLDTLSSQVGLPRLVKMDVERTEADALRGAPRLLREVRPVWIVELHGDEGHQAVDILREAGYRIRSLNKAESRIYREHILAEP
jgi:FkbM family methyltransferase